MTSTDDQIEAYYIDWDPQFHDPDAYDVDEYLDKVGKAKDQIDEALGHIENALDIHRTKGLEKVKKLLDEAFSRLEDES